LKIINFVICDPDDEWKVQEKRPVALDETMKGKLILKAVFHGFPYSKKKTEIVHIVLPYKYNLFVTSKKETTNSPIHEFINLKCCKMSLK
jgi:hypothetical protein